MSRNSYGIIVTTLLHEKQVEYPTYRQSNPGPRIISPGMIEICGSANPHAGNFHFGYTIPENTDREQGDCAFPVASPSCISYSGRTV